MESTLNSELLASMLKSRRGKKGLRDTAEEIGGISSATLSRVEQGNLPDVETFIRLCNWLDVTTDTFISGQNQEKREVSEKEKIVFQLRSSKELDADTINAMIHMVDMAFTKTKGHAQ
jgi:transcriptional regulator with XRE-family HTH domain